MTINKTKRYSIGIDPGRKTGFAVYDKKKDKIVRVETTDFWGAIEILRLYYPPKYIHRVIVELPKNKAVWRGGSTTKVNQRMGVDVGSVIREAELLVEYLRKNYYEYITQHPYGKMTAEQVKTISGYEGKTNQHVRDAIMLCVGV